MRAYFGRWWANTAASPAAPSCSGHAPALAVLAYVGGAGNHAFHEIAVVLKVVGVTIDPDTY